jgi:hypothetical protein
MDVINDADAAKEDDEPEQDEPPDTRKPYTLANPGMTFNYEQSAKAVGYGKARPSILEGLRNYGGDRLPSAGARERQEERGI